MRTALIFDHFGPYHLARAEAAARVLDLTCIELHAKSRSYGWDAGDAGKKPAVLSLPDAGMRGKEERAYMAPLLEEALGKAKPDVVAINGWGDFMSAESLRWCVRNGVPAIVMSETTAWDDARSPHREWIKSRMVRMFSAGLAGGSPQKEYLVQLGLPESAVEIGYDAVDNEYFAAKAEEVREELRVKSGELSVKGGEVGTWEEEKVERCEGGKVGKSEIGGRRSEVERTAKPYFLASARFIPKKNLGRLIEAYASYCQRGMEQGAGSGERGEQSSEAGGRMSEAGGRKVESRKELWDLVLLGDGPMRGELVRSAGALGLQVREVAPWECGERENDSVSVFRSTSGSVNLGKQAAGEVAGQAWRVASGQRSERGILWLPGFRQIDELPRFYARAGCFVHASTTEQWGLVVNEAMACGLPVIVSERCGCARDLVREGVNGFRFNPENTEQLADLLAKVAGRGFAREAFGEASRRIVADFGPERFARGLKAAAVTAVKRGPHRPTMIDRVILDLVCRR
jgi:1,2-diacylglycerol 3-alpha-glucosyltransferase